MITTIAVGVFTTVILVNVLRIKVQLEGALGLAVFLFLTYGAGLVVRALLHI